MVRSTGNLSSYKSGRSNENTEKDPPWAMMFAGDLVLCTMTREEVEEDLETWRVVFERHGLKISRAKTELILAEPHKLYRNHSKDY